MAIAPFSATTAKFVQEFLQLELGLKSAVKAEHVSPEQEAWLRTQAEQRGWSVLEDDEPTPSYAASRPSEDTTLFCGPDAALLGQLREWSHLQRSREASSDEKQAAIREIGRALGYPSCCVENYIRGREFPDQSLVFLRPAFSTSGLADARLNPGGNDELTSHVPCSYTCQRSIALADRTAAEWARRAREAWEGRRARMARPTVVFGERGTVRLTPAAHDEPNHASVAFTHADVSTLFDEDLRRAFAEADRLELTPGSFRLSRHGEPIFSEARSGPLDLPLLLRWGGPARRAVRIALIDLHRSLIDYMDTMTLPMLSGDLTHLGVQNEIVRLYVDRERPDTWPEAYRKLEDYVRSKGFTAAVWYMAYDERVARSLREAGLTSLLMDARFSGSDAPFDFVFTAPNRQGFCRFWRLWAEGQNAPRVPDLLHRSSERWSKAALAPPVDKPSRIDDRTFWPNTTYHVVAGTARAASDVWHLCVNPGCPYGKTLEDNPAFEGIELPALASARGCSFCEEGGDYDGAPAEPTLRSLLHQLEYITTRAPHSRFILLERAVFRFLPRFLQRADEVMKSSGRTHGRAEFYVTARTDEIVREQKRLSEALEVAEALGQLVNLYLVGIENFSQAELDLFNKGTSAEQQLEAIRVMRKMEERFPTSFTATRDAAHGFLLFTPWTTLDDLKVNAQCMKATRFWEIRSEATLSKLRLYPTVPLFYKARAEGLLEESYADAALDMSVRLGYSKEVPWRFLHREAGAVYRLLTHAAHDYPRGAREVDYLDAAIETVERDGPDASAEQLVKEFSAMRRARPGLGTIHRAPGAVVVSTRCNLGCTYCNRKSDRAPDEVALTEQLIQKRARGQSTVILNGAEPLMSPSLLRTARRARRVGFEVVAVETNTLGLDAAGVARLSAAGVTRIMPFLPGWDSASTSRIAREPQAGAWLAESARAVDDSGLEIQPVIPVARETLPELERFAEYADTLYPRARGLCLRFFPSEGELPHQRRDGAGEAPLVRLVEAADRIGLGVVQVGLPVVPPCALLNSLALHDLFVLDGPEQAGTRRVAACAACAVRSRCPGVSSAFSEMFPRARLDPVREFLPHW